MAASTTVITRKPMVKPSLAVTPRNTVISLTKPLTPVYLLSLCRRVFFGPRIPALAVVGDMKPRELLIGLCLLVPTLVIGFWPRVAIDLYEASTNGLATELAGHATVALAHLPMLG